MAKKPNGTKKVVEATQPKAEVTTKKVDDVVKIGKKPIMTYAHTAIIALVQLDRVTLQARGRNISIAADVSQIIVHRMAPLLQGKVPKISNVELSTEEVPANGGKHLARVTAIEVTIIC
jgi:DNA-binding protein Alba